MNESIYNNAGMPSEQGAAPEMMRKGWYICCDECGAEVFVSRWRWRAAFVFGTFRRRLAAGVADCSPGANPPELRFKNGGSR